MIQVIFSVSVECQNPESSVFVFPCFMFLVFFWNLFVLRYFVCSFQSPCVLASLHLLLHPALPTHTCPLLPSVSFSQLPIYTSSVSCLFHLLILISTVWYWGSVPVAVKWWLALHIQPARNLFLDHMLSACRQKLEINRDPGLGWHKGSRIPVLDLASVQI